MAERYQIISHNDNRMYQNDCPVICCAYNILLDTVTEDLLLQMKFDNLNTIPVRELTLSVDCFDVSGLLLSSDVELNYIVNDGSYRKPFGSDNAKNLPNNKTRKIAFKISSIVFADGSTWHTENSEDMKIVAEQIKAADHLVSAELIKEYELLTPDIHHERKWPVFENGYWLCACGELNINENSTCYSCSVDKKYLLDISDKSFITNRIIEQQRQKQKEYENQHQLLYDKGVEYFNNQNYKKAEKYFSKCIDWKEAKEYINKCKNIIAENKRRKAKRISTIFITIFIGVLVVYIIFPDGISYIENNIKIQQSLKNINIGDKVELGTYMQNDDVNKSPVQWIVLDKTDDSILLLSEKIIDYRYFNSGSFNDTNWDASEIREWLNNEFLTTTFSDTEIKYIEDTIIEFNGIKSTDKIFLLNKVDCEKYNKSHIMAKHTVYAKSQQMNITGKNYGYNGYGIYWLIDKTVVNARGEFNYYNKDYVWGIRPAIWISI